jgi:transcriptional regulator with XRE-family HTH domain
MGLPSIKASFGQKLKALRLAHRLSLSQFGAMIGYDRSYVYRLEHGESRNPSREFTEKVALRFGVPIGWLDGTAKQVATLQIKPVTNEEIRQHIAQEFRGEKALDSWFGQFLSSMSVDELRESQIWFLENSPPGKSPARQICNELDSIISAVVREKSFGSHRED